MLKREIIVDNLKVVYYEGGGLGQNPLVFLHGWKSEGRIIEGILDKIDNFVAIDLPGFGGSERPKEVWGIKDYANFLNDFLVKLGVDDPILMGHSFGGSVIIKYLSDEGRAEKAILIDSAGIRRKRARAAVYKIISKPIKLLLALPGIRKFRDPIRSRIYKKIGAEDYIEAGEMKEIYQKIINEDLRGEMKKIKAPVSLIWGEKDKETPLSDGREMNRLINNSGLKVIKEAGHWPFLEKREKFLELFLPLVSR